ncbi:MAG: class I SAM-dependent methyltransferase [Draconibacterium sp.]|nr:class I SAM-dependent methyltransferase [Draconibacterium sp.]
MSESGPFYSTFIDPLLTTMRKRVALEIKPNEQIIDIACGTGAQAFVLSKIAAKVTGVDLSESMITHAKSTSLKMKITNIDFFICDATDLKSFKNKNFNIAIMSLALHQFSPDLHAPILSEMKRVANKIILIDYNVPLPKNYTGIGSRVAEFLAGKEHNKNFKSFYKLGGLNEILEANNLKIEKSKLMGKGAFKMVVCS